MGKTRTSCRDGIHLHGIIDACRWRKAPRKVLLLLKEAHGECADWDLRKTIREEWRGPKYNIWWNAGYWCYAAQTCEPRIPGFPPRDDARTALLSSAAVNIKKSNGESSSIDEGICNYVKQDGDLLKTQISMIKPYIVICGNTWPFVKDLWPTARQVYDLVWLADSMLFFDFWHPANRFPHTINYYALECLIQNGNVAARAGLLTD